MAAKPTKVPVWNTGGSNNIEPAAGKKVTGWDPAEKPPVQDVHWLTKLIGEWLQYVSDGALTGNHSVTGTFLASGATTLQSTLDVTGLITATAGVTCAVNQDVAVSGTGAYNHGDFVKNVSSWSLGFPNNFGIIASGIESTLNGTIYGSVPFLVGDRVKSLEVSTRGNVATTGDWSISVWKVTSAGVVTLINQSGSAHTITNQTNAWATASIDLVDTTIATGDAIMVQIDANETGMAVGNLRWTYDHP